MNSEADQLIRLLNSFVEDQRTLLLAVASAEQHLSAHETDINIVDRTISESPNSYVFEAHDVSVDDFKTIFLAKHNELLNERKKRRGRKTPEEAISWEKRYNEIEKNFHSDLIKIGGDPENFIPLDLEITGFLLSPKSLNAINQSLYILAFANFEAFLHRATKICISCNDLILMSGTPKNYSWAEIREEGSVVKIREELIEDAANKLMHQSMSKWIKWYEDKTNLTIDEDFKARCNEFYELRNLFAHEKSSRSLYLNAANKDLIGSAADQLLKLACLIPISIAFKYLEKRELSRFLSMLSETTVKLLHRKRFSVVVLLTEKVLELSTVETWSDLFKVNNWIARSEIHGIEDIKNEIDIWDTSEKAPLYQLAKHSLLRERDEALDLFNSLEAAGELSLLEWETWPLFKAVK